MSEKSCDYLIIGSGIAGYHALKEFVKAKVNSRIILVTSDTEYPYDRPPLSKYYLRNEMPREKLFFERQDFYKNINNLEIILNKGVTKIDTKNHVAILENGDSIKFNKALIATGGRPRKLNLHGEEHGHYLRTLSDADKLKRDVSNAKNAVIIGAGFIGVEVASSLVTLGVNTTVIEVKPYIWNTFVDEKISRFIQQYFEKKGVKFLLNESVKEIKVEYNKVKGVITSSGKNIDADLVLVAVGIQPNVEIAKNSGIEADNGIIVDEYLRTSVKDIYAAGDVANIYDPREKKRKRIEHWNNAEYTGRLAARNMLGKENTYNFLSTVWSDIFDLHIESAGETMNYDEYIVRGKFDINSPSFAVIYLKNDSVRGYLAINRDLMELETLNNLIKNGSNISNIRDKLADENFDLSDLK
ncbi:FAD-dependent oxidoreductase [Sulfolobus sp. S-194]|uniref:NAD(P)/FAD-dependent oxidoreductase n=1 Tax=Sulfolobus sp. S-194 TaxID=2512240 RepID=UPI001436D198|nr:FAD-dependent oxidoreductase [Sulfolobus sp. S-194]QIW24635.1 FAD-dependent oxidoreductase [Sulfolobus sp. S-194]